MAIDRHVRDWWCGVTVHFRYGTQDVLTERSGDSSSRAFEYTRRRGGGTNRGQMDLKWTAGSTPQPLKTSYSVSLFRPFPYKNKFTPGDPSHRQREGGWLRSMAGQGAVGAMREVGSPRNAATGMRDEPCTPIFWRMSLASSVPFFGLSALRVVLAVLWLVVVCGCLLSCLTSSVLPLLAGWGGWRRGAAVRDGCAQ